MKTCFVVMPISSGEKYETYLNRYENIIKPAVEGIKRGDAQVFKCHRADLISRSGSITRAILDALYSSHAVIADLSDLNANVFYELGVRHSLRNKTILIAEKDTKPPFDVGDLRIVFYEDKIGGEKKAIPEIQRILESFLDDDERVDSPVFLAIPALSTDRNYEEIKARLYSVEQENEVLRTKISVAEQTNITLRDSVSTVTEAFNKIISRFGEDQRRVTEEEIEGIINERQQIIAKPKLFKVPKYDIDKNKIFVLMPFSEELKSVYEVIKRAAGRVGLRCFRVDELLGAFNITDKIFESVLSAGLIVADLTTHNSNVLYEVGIATTLGKEIIFLSQNIGDVPFDVRHIRTILYNLNFQGAQELEEKLVSAFTGYIEAMNK